MGFLCLQTKGITNTSMDPLPKTRKGNGLKKVFEEHVALHLTHIQKTGVFGFGGLRNKDVKEFVYPFADQIKGSCPRISRCVQLAMHVDKKFGLCPENLEPGAWASVEGGKLHKWLLGAKRISLSS